ncbi:MAG: Fe-S-containing hydro-lyase [Bacillota bacterium]
MAEKVISAPFTDEIITSLRSGDKVFINGVIYTGRDAAHKRLAELLEEGKELPVDLRGQAMYYVGPAPAKPGQAIGSCGPTTSYRMDAYTPALLQYGLKVMLGKGARNEAVKEAMKKYKAVYLAVVGGAAALLAKCVTKAEIVAYEDLGPEAIYRLEVENLPAIVINDCYGGDLYEEGRQQWAVNK